MSPTLCFSLIKVANALETAKPVEIPVAREMCYACTDLIIESRPQRIGRISSACQKVTRDFCSARGLTEEVTDQEGNGVLAIPLSLKKDFIAAFRGRLREDHKDYRDPVAEKEGEEIVAEGVVHAGDQVNSV